MAYCGSASKWAKIGLVFQYIGLALFLSGFGTIGWMVTQTVQDKTDITVGLFRMIDCSSGSCATSSVDDQYQNSKATALYFFLFFFLLKGGGLITCCGTNKIKLVPLSVFIHSKIASVTQKTRKTAKN